MPVTVFFSWQTDTPTGVGRNFIERALERAVAGIASDVEVEEVAREGIGIDRDTKGVPGSPPIVETIFRKIDQSAVFVPDLTFVGKRVDGRPTPNPNVLVEYGWALKSLGHARIVPVMNVAHGKPTPETMPFDLRHLRNPMMYELLADMDDERKRSERKQLAAALQSAIRTVLQSDEFKSSLPKASAPPPFSAKEPRDGHARFRQKGEPVAYSHDRIFGTQAAEVRLAEGASMWLRVMPQSDPRRTWNVTELKERATGDNRFLKPLGGEAYTSFDYMRHEDGFGIYGAENTADDGTSSIVFAFDSGEVWGVDSRLLERTKGGCIPFVEDRFSEALERFTNFIGRLGIDPPYRWIAGMEGLKGRSLCFPVPTRSVVSPSGVGHCVSDVVEAEGEFASGATPTQSLKPLFEKLFDRCGLVRPDYLDSMSSSR